MEGKEDTEKMEKLMMTVCDFACARLAQKSKSLMLTMVIIMIDRWITFIDVCKYTSGLI